MMTNRRGSTMGSFIRELPENSKKHDSFSIYKYTYTSLRKD